MLQHFIISHSKGKSQEKKDALISEAIQNIHFQKEKIDSPTLETTPIQKPTKEELFKQFASHREALVKKSYYHFKNMEDAEDNAHDVLEIAFLRWKEYTPEFPIAGWLQQISKFLIQQKQRDILLHEQLLAQNRDRVLFCPMEEAFLPEDPFAESDLQTVVELISKKTFIEMLKLRLAGYNAKEIAEELGLKKGYIQVTFCQERNALKDNKILNEYLYSE